MSQVGAPVKADQSEDTFSLTRAQLLMLFHGKNLGTEPFSWPRVCVECQSL